MEFQNYFDYGVQLLTKKVNSIQDAEDISSKALSILYSRGQEKDKDFKKLFDIKLRDCLVEHYREINAEKRDIKKTRSLEFSESSYTLDLDKNLITEEERQIIQKCFFKLNELNRITLNVELLGLKNTEMADYFGVIDPTMSFRRKRAKEALKKLVNLYLRRRNV